MINKLKGGHNMKTTNIVLTVFLIATLFGATFAAAAVGDIFSADTAAVSVASVASSISASDAMKTEIEIENEIEFETSTKNTVSKGDIFFSEVFLIQCDIFIKKCRSAHFFDPG